MSSDLNRAAVVRRGEPRARAVAAGQGRWLRWTLLDRYVLTELVGPFLFGVATFTSIFVAGQYLFKLTGFVAAGAPIPEVLALFGLKLVPMIVLTFPMACLLATLLAYGRLSGDMEITAMAAGGIPFMRIAVPAFLLGVVVSLGSFAINELVVPRAGRTSRVLETRISKALEKKGVEATFVAPGKAVVIQDFENGQLARVVIAREYDLEHKTLRDVTMLYWAKTFVTAIILADSAVWEDDHWVFNNPRVQKVQGAPAAAGSKRGARRYPLTGSFSTIDLKLNKTPDQVLSSQKDPDEMSFAELRGYLEALKDQNVKAKSLRELEVDLWNKTAIPFASLVFTLVGTPLALRRLRGGASVGLGLSVLIIFLYYIIWHGMSIMAQGGYLPPVWASWTANLLGMVAGGCLIARAAH